MRCVLFLPPGFVPGLDLIPVEGVGFDPQGEEATRGSAEEVEVRQGLPVACCIIWAYSFMNMLSRAAMQTRVGWSLDPSECYRFRQKTLDVASFQPQNVVKHIGIGIGMVK